MIFDSEVFYVLQDDLLFGELTVFEVRSGAEMKGLQTGLCDEQLTSALPLVDSILCCPPSFAEVLASRQQDREGRDGASRPRLGQVPGHHHCTFFE